MSSREQLLQHWLPGLLLVPLLSLATACNQEEPSVVESTTPSTSAIEEPSDVPESPDLTTNDATSASIDIQEPIQDIIVIVDASAQPSLIGKRVDLQNANVENVIGDRVFLIGNASEQVLVTLDKSLDVGAAEKIIDVDPGNTVDIIGTIMSMPTPEQAQQDWGLTPAETTFIQNEMLYVKADQINVR